MISHITKLSSPVGWPENHAVFFLNSNKEWTQLCQPRGFYTAYTFTLKDAYNIVREELKRFPGHVFMIRKVS